MSVHWLDVVSKSWISLSLFLLPQLNCFLIWLVSQSLTNQIWLSKSKSTEWSTRHDKGLREGGTQPFFSINLFIHSLHYIFFMFKYTYSCLFTLFLLFSNLFVDKNSLDGVREMIWTLTSVNLHNIDGQWIEQRVVCVHKVVGKWVNRSVRMIRARNHLTWNIK